jgi:hypothetical protein
MGILMEISYYAVFVIFAGLVMLWRRANDWESVPFPRRLVLAISASRNWWLAYSVGYLAYLMGWCGYSFRHSAPVVLFAIALAALLALLRIPK